MFNFDGWVIPVFIIVGMIPVVVGWFFEYRSVRKATGHYEWTLWRVVLWGGLTLFSPLTGAVIFISLAIAINPLLPDHLQ